MPDTMTNNKLKVRRGNGVTYYVFWCEGCQETHSFEVRHDGKQPTWTFNGDFDSPTFQPSLKYPRCHLWLENGVINYCDDCRHRYRSLKVPLKEY